MGDGSAVKVARVDNAASTSTGTFPSTGSVHVDDAFRFAAAAIVHPSTKPIAWRMQGDIGGAAAWQNLNAFATTSTGGVIVASTVAGVWTDIRIQVSGNDTTGNVTTRWNIIGQ